MPAVDGARANEQVANLAGEDVHFVALQALDVGWRVDPLDYHWRVIRIRSPMPCAAATTRAASAAARGASRASHAACGQFHGLSSARTGRSQSRESSRRGVSRRRVRRRCDARPRAPSPYRRRHSRAPTIARATRRYDVRRGHHWIEDGLDSEAPGALCEELDQPRIAAPRAAVGGAHFARNQERPGRQLVAKAAGEPHADDGLAKLGAQIAKCDSALDDPRIGRLPTQRFVFERCCCDVRHVRIRLPVHRGFVFGAVAASCSEPARSSSTREPVHFVPRLLNSAGRPKPRDRAFERGTNRRRDVTEIALRRRRIRIHPDAREMHAFDGYFGRCAGHAATQLVGIGGCQRDRVRNAPSGHRFAGNVGKHRPDFVHP